VPEGEILGVGLGAGPDAEAFITVATVEHDAVLCIASVALHEIGVVPTGNSEPDGGEHAVEIGGVPPLTATPKEIATGLPLYDVADGAGHEIDGGAVDGKPGMPETSCDGKLTAPAALYASTTK
jgi:hypothetical protein